MQRKLHDVRPREQSGRDSFSRYKAQVRSAAVAALSILEGGEVDRVYCDLHDDFVIRRVTNGNHFYTFVQVKTHGTPNHQWTINKLFGLCSPKSPQDVEKIRDSFIGKLLSHTVIFGSSCQKVVFQTNVHVKNDVDSLLTDLMSDEFSNGHALVLVEKFKECFPHDGELTCPDILSRLKKLDFETDVQYLKPNDNNFEPLIREKIYQYSEVELSRTEGTELLLKLLNLVETKSSGKIDNITEETVEVFAGIAIEDLLRILSISEDAYRSLIAGGDTKAVKSASIIQRTLVSAGADSEQIEYCSRCKTKWDVWLRGNRHRLPELEINSLLQKIRYVLLGDGWSNSHIELSRIRYKIKDLLETLDNEGILYDIDQDLLLGAFFAEIVRMKS